MFARVFNTAKRILSRSPSVQRSSEEARELTPNSIEVDASADMVTTRRGTGTTGSVTGTPRSSARKSRPKRSLEAEETPTATKKRRTSARINKTTDEYGDKDDEGPAALTRAQSEDPQTDASENIVLAVPHRFKERTESLRPGEEPKVVVHTSPKVVVPSKTRPRPSTEQCLVDTEEEQVATSAEESAEPAGKSAQIDSPPPVEDNEVEDSVPSPTKIVVKRTRRSKGASGSRPESPDEIPSSTWESEQAAITSSDPKNAHVRFDSEEPMDRPTSMALDLQGSAQDEVGETLRGEVAVGETQTALEEKEEEDLASDSDEEPEMVTAASAASKAKAAEEETARALQAQQEQEARRRQQRAERMAEEQAEKRIREEKKARKLAKLQAREARARQQEEATVPESSFEIDVHNLPALLPSSVLDAAGDHRPPTPPTTRPRKTAEELRKERLNHHIKFLERGEKSIKDVKKGSVNVSVLAQQNKLLAPKVNKATKNIREHWLKGRRQEQKRSKRGPNKRPQKVERRAFGGGFLRDNDD